MNFEVNLNTMVRVKLTEFGEQVLQAQHELQERVFRGSGTELQDFELRLDDEGYYQTQLWIFIEKFGPHIGIGLPNVIEDNNMIIENGTLLEEENK